MTINSELLTSLAPSAPAGKGKAAAPGDKMGAAGGPDAAASGTGNFKSHLSRETGEHNQTPAHAPREKAETDTSKGPAPAAKTAANKGAPDLVAAETSSETASPEGKNTDESLPAPAPQAEKPAPSPDAQPNITRGDYYLSPEQAAAHFSPQPKHASPSPEDVAVPPVAPPSSGTAPKTPGPDKSADHAGGQNAVKKSEPAPVATGPATAEASAENPVPAHPAPAADDLTADVSQKNIPPVAELQNNGQHIPQQSTESAGNIPLTPSPEGQKATPPEANQDMSAVKTPPAGTMETPPPAPESGSAVKVASTSDSPAPAPREVVADTNIIAGTADTKVVAGGKAALPLTPQQQAAAPIAPTAPAPAEIKPLKEPGKNAEKAENPATIDKDSPGQNTGHLGGATGGGGQQASGDQTAGGAAQSRSPAAGPHSLPRADALFLNELSQAVNQAMGDNRPASLSPLSQTGMLTVQEVAPPPSQTNILAAAMPAKTTPPPVTPQMLAKQIGIDIARQAAEGQDSFKISLKPAELGKVDIRMDFHADGRMGATVTVENERTLALLQRDQAALEKALENAGFNAGGNNLNFSLKKQHQEPNTAPFSNAGTGEEGGDAFPLADSIISRQNMKMSYSDNALDINI